MKMKILKNDKYLAPIAALAILAIGTAVRAVPNVSQTFSLPWVHQENVSSNESPQLEIAGSQKPTIVVPEEQATIQAVAGALPSVVSIIVSKEISAVPQQLVMPFNDSFGFPQFKIVTPNGRDQKTKKQEVGSGTGFVVDQAKGLILTNKHVADDPKAEYEVVIKDGTRIPATVVDRDPVNDLAVLQVKRTDLPALKLGNSLNIQLGQTVIAVGNALGQFQNSVTKGVVSGIGRSITAGTDTGSSERLDNVIQTDAAINPGNSGGPLLNLQGEVIGINSAVSMNGQSVGFAIPIDIAKSVISSVQKTGKISRPYLGVRYVVIDAELAKEQSLGRDYGALIGGGSGNDSSVIADSPAAKAGLKNGDIIIAVNGTKLQNGKTLAVMMQQFIPGDEVVLTVYRAGVEQDIRVKLGEFSH